MTTIIVGDAVPKTDCPPPYHRVEVGDWPSITHWLSVNAMPHDEIKVAHPAHLPQSTLTDISEAVRRGLKDAQIRVNTTSRASRLWVYHMLTTRRHWWDAGVPWRNTSRGAVIIAAAGPSLDMALQQYAGDIPIWCVNTSYRSLAAHGITPELLLSIETVDVSSHLDGLPRPRMVLDRTAHPAMWQAGEILGSVMGPMLSAWRLPGTMPILEGGYCAAQAAYALAVYAGYDTIILIGQDLAYARDGRSYSRSTAYAAEHIDDQGIVTFSQARRAIPKAHLHHQPPTLHVRAWSGDVPVKTSEEWDLFRRWYERRKEPVRRINATGAGAHLEGWEHLELWQAQHECEPGTPLRWHSPDHGSMSAAMSTLRRQLKRILRLRSYDAIAGAISKVPLLVAWVYADVVRVGERSPKLVKIAHRGAIDLLQLTR